VLHTNSGQYDKLVTVKNDEKTKYLRADGRISLYTTSFSINGKTYIIYSYTSQDRKNYLIKENETNIIVYAGNSNIHLVDGLHLLDGNHFLLIEKNGDFNSSRSAFVLTGEKIPWKKVKAFEGKAFGQDPGGYFTKKFIKKREEFQLECGMDFTLSAPGDINSISFDPITKTISYKQYFENKKYKVISARWEHKTFVIDDYNVNENLSGNSVGVPD
jgi:hypothetical protein